MISCSNGTSPSGGNPEGQPVTITYNANGWTGGGIPRPVTGKSGDPIGAQAIIPLDETETQICLGWSLTSGQSGEKIAADYKVTGNITLYALWQKLVEEGQPVTISYNANGWTGDGVPTTPVTDKNSGDQIGAANLPALADANGQVFYGWAVTSGQTGTRLTATYSLRGNITLYVLWRSPVILTFDYNYAAASTHPDPVEVGKGIPIGNVLPAVVDTDNPVAGQPPTYPNHLFQGWYTEAAGGTKATTASIFNENTTLYAQWIVEPSWGWLDLDLTMMPLSQPTPGNQWPADLAKAEFNNGVLTWTFTQNNQRGILLFSPGQRRVLEKIDDFRLVIDGEAASGTGTFRFFIGNMNVGQDWNGTAAITAGTFDTQVDNIVTFNSNKMKTGGDGADGTEDTRTGSYILQQRVATTTVLTIRSIKIRYNEDKGGPAPPPAFRVTFDRNYDNAPAGPNPVILEAGDAIGALPVITRDLYTFNGWYDAPTGGTKIIPEDTFDDAAIVYAQWIALPTVAISYDLNYTGAPTGPADVTILKDGAITTANLPAVTRAGFSFKGWSKESGGGDANAVTAATTFSADATLYAQWEASNVKYLVTFNKGYGNDNLVISTTQVLIGGSVGETNMPANPTRQYYTFAGWYTAQTGGAVFTKDTPITTGITVYARWTFVGTPGAEVTFNLDLTNLPTSQGTDNSQWLPGLAAASVVDGKQQFVFNNTAWSGDNNGFRQRALINLTDEQAAFMAAAPATGITVEIRGSKAGANAIRCGFVISANSTQNWNSTNLPDLSFTDGVASLTFTRETGRTSGAFMLQLYNDKNVTETLVIESIKVTFTQPAN